MTKASSWWRAGRSGRAFVLSIVTGVALSAGPASTALAGAKRRVGVDVNGPHASAVHEAIADVLKHHGFEPTSADLTGDSDDAIASAAKKGHLSAIILGEVKDAGKRAKLRVYGASGDLIGEGSWAEAGGPKKLAGAVERTLWARVGGALAKARGEGGKGAGKGAKAAAEPEEAEPAEEKSAYSRSEEREATGADAGTRSKKKAAADEGEGGDAGAGTALDVGVGVRFFSRALHWVNNTERDYTMGYAPAVGVTLAWYPAAHFRGGWPANIGLAAVAEYTPGLQSKTDDGTKYPTDANDYSAGVRGRLALGRVEGALTLGGGQHAFIIHSGAVPRSMLADLPDVAYTYARAGLDLRIALPANLSLTVGGGYRYVLGAGKTNYLLEATFPNAKISGFDAGAGLGFRLLPFLEVRGGFDIRRYQITTGNPAVSSGTDQTLAFWGQLAVLLDGWKGGAEGGRPPAPSSGGEAKDDPRGDSKGEKDEDP
jgi:hypothetical protein